MPFRPSSEDALLYRRGRTVLWFGLFLLLTQPFLPVDQFIHRSDDAFYYFQVAANHVRHGFWTFDGSTPTNGVQPLWAWTLTAVAHASAIIGLTDKLTLARIFSGVSVAAHFSSVLVLLYLLKRRTTPGLALAAAGGLLFPLNVIWSRGWGMENSLYGLALVGSIAYFELRHRPRPTVRSAAVLGLLLGATTLTRLNAGLFAMIFGVYYLWRVRTPARLADRAKLMAVTTIAASILVVPYLWFNRATTGHLLPVSGAVKAVQSEQFLDEIGVDSTFSPAFAREMAPRLLGPVRWFLTTHVWNGTWAIGGRAFDERQGSLQPAGFAVLLAVLLGVPCLYGRPREWLAWLGARFAMLAPFGYVAVFAVANAAVSVLLYPTQVRYALIRWWLVEGEIVLTVLGAALAVAWVSYLGRPVAGRLRAQVVVPLALSLLGVVQAGRAYEQWFGGRVLTRDWNQSWNDEMYRAAQWLRDHAPEDALVGAWNAGVIAYFSTQPVVNLDGLINNFDLVPYLAERRVADYIRARGIRYLADMDGTFHRPGAIEGLTLTEVYSSHNEAMGMPYRIFRVDQDR